MPIRRLVAACLVAASVLLFAAPAQAHYLDVKCADASPYGGRAPSSGDCRHVQDRIHDIWPKGQRHHAIVCFSYESGLDKWANVNETTCYKGIAQMGCSERQQTDWSWRVEDQVRAALRWWRGAGWDAWHAYGC